MWGLREPPPPAVTVFFSPPDPLPRITERRHRAPAERGDETGFTGSGRFERDSQPVVTLAQGTSVRSPSWITGVRIDVLQHTHAAAITPPQAPEGIWPENAAAVEIWIMVQTQWRLGADRRADGADYAGMMTAIRVMEWERLRVTQDRRRRESGRAG